MMAFLAQMLIKITHIGMHSHTSIRGTSLMIPSCNSSSFPDMLTSTIEHGFIEDFTGLSNDKM